MVKQNDFNTQLKSGIISFWKIGPFAKSLPGILRARDDETVEIEIRISRENIGDLSREERSFLDIKLRKITELHGFVQDVGIISALNCHVSSVREFIAQDNSYIILVRPLECWYGTRNLNSSRSFKRFSLSYLGVDALAQGVIIEDLHRYNDEDSAELDLHGSGKYHTAILVGNHPNDSYNFEFLGYNVSLNLNGGITTTYTANNGLTLSTRSIFFFSSKTDIPLTDIYKIKYSFDTLIGVASLQPPIVDAFELYVHPAHEEEAGEEKVEPERYTQFFRLGEGIQRTKSPNRVIHRTDEALFVFGADEMDTSHFLQKWFSSNEDRHTARWLFRNALSADSLSINRYLDIAKAIEVVGAELAVTPYNKTEFKIMKRRFANDIATALANQGDGVDFEHSLTRVDSALNSINSVSFGSKIQHFVETLPSEFVSALYPNKDDFIQKIKKCRDVLTHLRNESTVLNEYERIAFSFTYKLIIMYASFEAAAIGISEEKILTALYNSELGGDARYS